MVNIFLENLLGHLGVNIGFTICSSAQLIGERREDTFAGLL